MSLDKRKESPKFSTICVSTDEYDRMEESPSLSKKKKKDLSFSSIVYQIYGFIGANSINSILNLKQERISHW